MLTKAVALLSQTFRVDVRQLRTHLLRGAVAAGVLWLLIIVHMENRFSGSPGLEFCTGLAISTMVMMTLMGAFYFPSVITEEKEEHTLGLLRMAGVNSVTLLLGKSVARVGVILLLIAVSLPYWWLGVTLGGVTISQIMAISIALAAHLALMSQIGTLCSVYFTTTGRACVASTIILFLVMIAPAIADEILQDAGIVARGTRPFFLLYRHQAPYQLMTIIAPGYFGGLWTTQVWTNLLAAFVLFCLSWLLLERLNMYEQVPGRESKLKSWMKAFLPEAVRQRRRARRSPTGPTAWAIVWKDFWLFGGGYKWWILRVIGYACMAFLFSLDGWGSIERRIGVGLILTSFWAGIAEIVFHAGHLFQREIKQQTWDSLRMLPVSTGLICRRKILGASWALVPTFIALFLGMALERQLFKEILREFDRSPGVSFCVSFYCFAGTILAVFITCYFGLRVNPWLGSVLAAGTFGFITITPFMCCFGVMQLHGDESAAFVFLSAGTLDLMVAAGFLIPIRATLNGEVNG